MSERRVTPGSLRYLRPDGTEASAPGAQANLGPAFDWADDGSRRGALQIAPGILARAHRFQDARRIDALLQAAIAVLSLVAIALVASDGPAQRYGFVLGLCSQPFWIAATWRARQWGMLFLAIFYCGIWTQGILIRF